MLARLSRFAAYSPAERSLLVEAGALLLVVRLLLRPTPFTRLRAGLDRLARRSRRGLPRSVEQVAWGIGMAQPFVPRASCLTQALAADVLLRRSGHDALLHLGVRHAADGAVRAHAWLESGGRIVVGGPGHERYEPLTSIASTA